MDHSSQQLLKKINVQFVEIVGPIGKLLIEDAIALWKQKQWKGPSALRHYVTALANNIDDSKDKEQFIKATSELAMAAVAERKNK